MAQFYANERSVLILIALPMPDSLTFRYPLYIFIAFGSLLLQILLTMDFGGVGVL